MNKSLIILIVVMFSANLFSQEDRGLPHFMNAYEKSIYDEFIKNPPVNGLLDPNPPPGPVRTMAEWEELQGVIITWTSFQPILRQIVDYAQEECLVYIVCSDSNTVKTYLQGAGVPLTNLKYLVTPFNSIWCRDYGPWAVYSNNCDTLRMIDWVYNRPARPLDDAVPVFFSNYINVPIHQTINMPNRLIATGGNFMVDGNGTAFSSKLIQNENPSLTIPQIEGILNSYMGVTRYVRMETLPYDQIHHIDMHLKLLNEETILCGQYPTGVADGPQIELNLQYILTNYQTCYGRPYKVVRIPMPPGPNGQYPNNGDDYRTYTNSVFLNKTVLVPTYAPQYDTTALRIYRENLPGYKIYGIDCNSIIPSLGAIHCITKEIGVNEPIFISHAALQNTSNTTTPYEVKAFIRTKSGVSSAKMYWTIDTTAGFTPVTMTAIGDTFRANIPAQPLNTKVYYYIWANSVSGRTVTKPLPAPSGNYRFNVTNIIGIAENNNTIPKNYKLYNNFPNPFNPSTQIKFDIPLLRGVDAEGGRGVLTQLKIFDILGREVQTLVNGQLKPGSYNVTWDASGFPSGVYFYKLTAGSFTSTHKMVLIK